MSYLIPPRTARGFGATAVTPHELSTLAAVGMMSSGGNAVDGAIAANAVQGVVAPETCGVGGDLFALLHTPASDTPMCLNASGRAGSGSDAQALRDFGETTMPLFGPASITVPGCVDGWYALLDRYGTMDMADVLAPALRFATEGFATSTELAGAWAQHGEQLMTQRSASPMFPGGQPPTRGQHLRRPMLAETLRSIISGRDDFYVSRIGPGVAEATNGWITADDLSRDQAEWVDPLGLEVFDRVAWTVPPNSQGYLTLATLGIFELLDPPTDSRDPAFTHALVEAYRSVVWERDELVADPETAPLPPSDLVAAKRLESSANQIDPDRAGTWADPTPAPGGTAYLCVVDAAGLGVSLIQSNFHGIGSGLSAADTGVWLHNRGGGFNLRPGHANELAPGRRPLHTLSPTIWTRNGDLELVLGTRGGHRQPQLLAQLAAHLFHAGLDLSEAQTHPRWMIGELKASTSHVVVEDRMAADVKRGLTERGHELSESGDWMGEWGPISAIALDSTGRREAAADPRVDTTLALAG